MLIIIIPNVLLDVNNNIVKKRNLEADNSSNLPPWKQLQRNNSQLSGRGQPAFISRHYLPSPSTLQSSGRGGGRGRLQSIPRKRSSGPWPPQGTGFAAPFQAASVDFQQQYYVENEDFDASCANDESLAVVDSVDPTVYEHDIQWKNGLLPVRQTVIEEVCDDGYLATVEKLEGCSSLKKLGCSIVDNNLKPYIVSSSVMMALKSEVPYTDDIFCGMIDAGANISMGSLEIALVLGAEIHPPTDDRKIGTAEKSQHQLVILGWVYLSGYTGPIAIVNSGFLLLSTCQCKKEV